MVSMSPERAGLCEHFVSTFVMFLRLFCFSIFLGFFFLVLYLVFLVFWFSRTDARFGIAPRYLKQ